MKGWRLTVAALALALPTACTVKLSKESVSDFARNECKSDSECGAGQCQSGACVAHKGAFSTLLLAIAPPLGATGVGGVRTLLLKTDFDTSNEDTKIDLSPTTVVHGFVSAPAGCGVGSTSAAPTFRAQVTLTPHEESYGLPTVTYVARTSSVILPAVHPCVGTAKGQVSSNTTVDEFVVALPGGPSSYDVYVEPLPGTNGTNASDGGAPGSCQMVPQLFRNVSAGECLNLVPGKPQTLDVVIPWPKIATGSASLDGWTLDVVQPITGQVISDRVVLGASDRVNPTAGPGYEVGCATCRAFHYARGAVNVGAPVAGDEPGKELVRLSPPEHTVGPVIQAELSGLEATDATRAVFPALGPFPAAVLLDAVVNERDSLSGVPRSVPSDVTLTATELYGIKPGIFASFSTTGVVGTDGSLSVSVLPGMYRARVVPHIGLGFAASESTLDVACEHDPSAPDGCLATALANPPVRGGLVLRVPPAAQITGDVVDAVAQVPIDRASVQAGPAAFGVRQCPKGVDASVCAAEALGVLDLSLGEDAFVPRSVSTVTEHGTFTLKEVDCGGCAHGSDVDAAGHGPGALFDISVRPPDGSRFPWLLRPSVTVDGGLVALGRMSLPLPIIHRGTVEIAPQDNQALPVSSALISAYVMRDERGAVIDSLMGLSSCAMRSASPSPRCIRSVLKVAETIAAQDGTFELVIPSAIP